MCGALAQRLDPSAYRIIDSHAHLGEVRNFHIAHGYLDDLIAEMDALNVSAIAISAMVGLYCDAALGNDWVAQAIARYPGRIIGMALCNPNTPDRVLPELTRCIDQLGMSMIKLHPEEAGCPMTRGVYEQIYGFAQERGLAIMNHDWQSPQRLEKLAGAYPRVRFVQAHSAGNWDGHRDDDYFRLARDYENVYVDICASPIYYDALEKLVGIAGEDNILFGSDMPFLNLGFELAKVLMADLSADAKQKILADNFLRVLRRQQEV